MLTNPLNPYAITIATTFIPAIKTVFGFAGKGTWVSPTRTKMTKKEGDNWWIF